MFFILRGDIKPYVRMTQRGKYIRVQAREYLASKDSLAWQMKIQMEQHGWRMFQKTPLMVSMLFLESRGLHRRDLDNEEKAVLDAANMVVYIDDRWIDAKGVSLRIRIPNLCEGITLFLVEPWRGNG